MWNFIVINLILMRVPLTEWSRHQLELDFEAIFSLHACRWHRNVNTYRTNNKLPIDKRCKPAHFLCFYNRSTLSRFRIWFLSFCLEIERSEREHHIHSFKKKFYRNSSCFHAFQFQWIRFRWINKFVWNVWDANRSILHFYNFFQNASS